MPTSSALTTTVRTTVYGRSSSGITMLHGDPCPADAYNPPHDMDSKVFLELFLEKDLSPSPEKEILEEYLLK